MALEIPFGPDQTMVGRQCRRRRGRQLGTLVTVFDHFQFRESPDACDQNAIKTLLVLNLRAQFDWDSENHIVHS